MCTFGHLHVHSEYSALDGLSKVKELIQTAKSHGQSFIALSDHGTTSGLYDLQKYGDEEGIKVINACEFYYERETDGGNGHLLVLAKNNVGLANLFKLQHYAYTDGFYKKPRINWEVLVTHKSGLIITTACLGSPFNQYLLNDDIDGATRWAERAKQEFGEDFYVEIQPNQIPEQHVCNKESIRIANALGVELVATNDVHYTNENDCFPHEVMLALQTRAKMSDEKRFKFTTTDFWLKTEEEMYDSFEDTGLDRSIVDIALANTRKIADKCTARIEKGNFLPAYHDTSSPERTQLINQTMKGAKELGLNKDKGFMADVQEEINVIDRNGYSGYFLIVGDYVRSARDNGNIVGDGRGSGAGSKVAYLTDITKIPPHEYDLLFERFMADGRQPDFDVDFSDQDSVFTDLQNKYGESNVARIIAFGTLTPKAVIRKVFNAFDHPMSLQGEITKLVPDLCESLEQAYSISPALLDYKRKYPVEWAVIERLEGVVSHESQHAGGVLIYPNITSLLPVKTKSDDRTKLIVGFDKYMLEELGHYKFDILGLETLPIIKHTLDSIQRSTGIKIDLSKINLEDADVYKSLCTGDVSGVFQLSAQSAKVMEQAPNCFRDLIAINALIRPGVGDWDEYIARRKGKEWFKDENRPWMHETLGTMTYQEQFLLDGARLADWSIADADKWLRKNKDIRNDKELEQKFKHALYDNGTTMAYADDVWKEIEDAVDGGYSFNKSHSASYAMLSYQTAWLKYYYPVHYYASLMSSEKTDGDGQNEIARYMAELKKRGIPVNPPDINLSNDNYVVIGDSISYRITTIKHVGESAIKSIQSLRPISSFGDFLARREKQHIKQNVLVNLIKAGCFDFDNIDRSWLLWQVDMENRTKTQIKNEVEVEKYEYSEKIKLEWEKDVLGMYLSSHPMERYGFKPLSDFAEGGQALVGGEVTEVKIFLDKNKNEMAFVTLDTLYGSVKLLLFSNTWARKDVQALMVTNSRIMVKGKKSGNDVMVNTVEVLE